MWKMQQHFPQYSEINICSCLVFFKMCFSSVKKRKIQKLLKQKEKIKIKYNPTTPKLPLLNVWYTLLALFLSIQALFPVLHFVVVFYEFYKFMSSINFCTDYTWIFCFVWLLFFCCLFCFHFFVLFCFWTWNSEIVFIEFVTILFPFYVLVFGGKACGILAP